jgi:hypothetical protein
MVPLSNRNFAFIVNVESFPSPYLVEMSRRRRMEKKNENFYKLNVVFAPPKMNFIFKSILDHGPLFKMHLQVIKETMLEHLKTLLHWFAHNYTTEFDSIILSCKFYFIHIIFRKNYARDTCVI